MTEPGADKGFEFGAKENEQLLSLSKDLTRLGIATLVAGVLFVLYLLVSYIDPTAVVQVSDARHTALSFLDYVVWGLIALLVIYMSITIIRLAIPIKMIVATSGLDIAYLMSFVEKLGVLSKVSFVSLTFICVLMAISLIMLILVF
jgi:hypothetical protein